MPSGNCSGCKRFSRNLDSINGRCPVCQALPSPARVAPAPAEPAPDHRADELKKWVEAEIKLASRLGGSCEVCKFSVMSDRLRCHRLPPVNTSPGGAAARPGIAGGRWEFPTVLPFSSCGEFIQQEGQSKEREGHPEASTAYGGQTQQQLNLTGSENLWDRKAKEREELAVQQQASATGSENMAGAVAGYMAMEAAETAAYLWYVNQIENAYTETMGNMYAEGLGNVEEDPGNFFESLFDF